MMASRSRASSLRRPVGRGRLDKGCRRAVARCSPARRAGAPPRERGCASSSCSSMSCLARASWVHLYGPTDSVVITDGKLAATPWECGGAQADGSRCSRSLRSTASWREMRKGVAAGEMVWALTLNEGRLTSAFSEVLKTGSSIITLRSLPPSAKSPLWAAAQRPASSRPGAARKVSSSTGRREPPETSIQPWCFSRLGSRCVAQALCRPSLPAITADGAPASSSHRTKRERTTTGCEKRKYPTSPASSATAVTPGAASCPPPVRLSARAEGRTIGRRGSASACEGGEGSASHWAELGRSDGLLGCSP
mmetsp:Transcript_87409/g.271582  ORF Transcript_87409/g.271582 Transcript_87409/m.271582 type:complete len:308 (-) Transcript_87409:636-1559(-)